MRRLRPFFDLTLPLIGGFILLDSFIVVSHVYHQMALAGIGFVVVLIGSWRLYHPLLPDERRFHILRREVEGFLDLVRQMNRETLMLKQACSEQRHGALKELHAAMHDSVDRMIEYAGLADYETPFDPPDDGDAQIETSQIEADEAPVGEKVADSAC